jgi:hypothetical protein
MSGFHTLKASAALSGLNVSLREGTVYADNMSLNKNQLVFKDVTSGISRESIQQHTGIFYNQQSSFLNTVTTIDHRFNEYGIDLSITNFSNVSRVNETDIGLGSMILLKTDEDDTRHRMTINPKEVNVSTSNFSVINTGSVAIEGKGVTINTNVSGLSLRGDLISTETGGFINQYLKVQIYDNASSMYRSYVIPLMSPP